MKVTNVEKKEKSTVELTIQVDAQEFEAAVQKAYVKNRGQVNVPGFRKGKAPRKIIEAMYGTSMFYQDAIDAVYPQAYAAAVKEQGLDDVGYPKLEIESAGAEGMIFKALVSVRPEVKLGQYKGLTAPKEVAAVTDEDIQEELKPFISRATRLVSVDQAVKQGDTAIIDFEGFDNGVPFDGGKGENYSLQIGSGSFVPGFEEQLIGMKPGDEAKLDITFPADYVPDLAGKAVVFQVKIVEVKESQEPTVDDEFAKDVSEFETLEALKKDLADKLKLRREVEADQAHEDAVMNQLVDGMECEIPDGMLEVQMDKIMDDYAMRLQNQGIGMDDYMKMMGIDAGTLRASARPAALKQVQMELAFAAVADAEGIQITDEDVEAEMARLAEEYKLELKQVKAAIPADNLMRDMRLRKASELVKAEAKIGPAPEKGEEAPKKAARKKKTDDTEVAAEVAPAEKPKRTRKKADAE